MVVAKKPGKRAVKDTAERPLEVGQPAIAEIVAKQMAKELIGIMASKNLSMDNAGLALSIAQDYIHEFKYRAIRSSQSKRGKKPVSEILDSLKNKVK